MRCLALCDLEWDWNLEFLLTGRYCNENVYPESSHCNIQQEGIVGFFRFVIK